MILKKIKLKNIRSYKEKEFTFPMGSTLLSGDIGSGKTSILLAIEFALFGLQPGQRGASLLRNGEVNGGVTIIFEVDGKEIIIERTLKKAKTISQDYCSISVNGEKKEVSVTELKSRVLDLLNYPREFSKKQNLLYKFTVYTPQEEMKQIILQDPETRINTLRHVFGIDKYKRILENVTLLASKLREEKRIKQALTSNLEQEKLLFDERKKDLEIKKVDLILLEKKFESKVNYRKKIEQEKLEISFKIEEKKKLEQEIEKTKIAISTKRDSIFSNKKLIEQIKEEIDKLKQTAIDESKIPKLEQDLNLLKEKKQQVSDENIKILSQINSLENKNNDNESIKKKISHLDLCPTCLQDVGPVYKSNVINKLDSEITSNINKIKELEVEKTLNSQELKKIESEILSKEKELNDLKILKIKLQGIKEKEIRLNQVVTSNNLLEKDIDLLEKHIDSLKEDSFKLSKYENIFEEKEKELNLAFEEERMTEIKVAELRKEIDLFEIQIQELKTKIQETKRIKEKLEYITSLENWLSKKFIPLISHIEKNVMIKLKMEFSELFAKWFSMLVSDNFNVSLNDNFTPIIEFQDYEIDYAYLSGGERTAVALAYRLALNQVINSLMSKIKTRDLVILDEPTDGFSEQQLDKMREVLDQLNVAQLIIVSHEKKIEGFVENVIRLKKENGVSDSIEE